MSGRRDEHRGSARGFSGTHARGRAGFTFIRGERGARNARPPCGRLFSGEGFPTHMKCKQCGTFFFLGGIRRGEQRFCNHRCDRFNYELTRSEAIPTEVVDDQVRRVHEGPCPRCQGPGPVDIFSSYRVWSVLLVTSWSRRCHICCRSCAVKSQLGDTLFATILGWWSLWGIVATPLQIGKNIVALLHPPDPSRPSEALRKQVRITLAPIADRYSKT